MGNYPRFFGKDASNLPNQPTLFEIVEETEQVMADLVAEMQQLETDLRFLQLIIKEFGRG